MNSLPLDYTRCSSNSCILRAKCLRWTDTTTGERVPWSDFTDSCESAAENYFILDERKQLSD